MTTLREAAQQALEALESLQGGCTDSNDGTVEAITVWCPEVIDALRAALEQPEQEPVACPHRDEPRGCYRVRCQLGRKCVEPLYTHPPRREWKKLNDTEIGMLYVKWDATPGGSMADFARAVEAALKEKNQ